MGMGPQRINLSTANAAGRGNTVQCNGKAVQTRSQAPPPGAGEPTDRVPVMATLMLGPLTVLDLLSQRTARGRR